jgi:hypothetical protein
VLKKNTRYLVLVGASVKAPVTPIPKRELSSGACGAPVNRCAFADLCVRVGICGKKRQHAYHLLCGDALAPHARKRNVRFV